MILAWLITPGAVAACPEPYPLDALLDDVGLVESSLRDDDSGSAARAAVRLRRLLPCLDEVLPEPIAPRTLRAIGAGLLVEPAAPFALESIGWLNASAELDPEHRYALEDLPEDHQLFAVWASALALVGTVESVELEGTLIDGAHWLDGRPLQRARLRPDVPHLYQLQPRDTRQLTGWIRTDGGLPGAAFVPLSELPVPVAPAPVPVPAPPSPAPPSPEPLVGHPPVPTPVPVPEPLGQPITEITPAPWPLERVALVTGGGAALLSSGVLYGLSVRTEDRFLAATSKPEIDRWRIATNRLAVGSGAAATVGVSALSFGLLFYVVDGQPGPTLDLRF